jgi:hypothetical protein
MIENGAGDGKQVTKATQVMQVMKELEEFVVDLMQRKSII